VDAGTPAVEAGIKPGDILVEVGLPDGRNSFARIRIDSADELQRLATRREALILKLFRGGDSQTVTLKPSAEADDGVQKKPHDARKSRAPLTAPAGG
jgi:hypothetical protein